jgi:hypothetical protein
MIFASACEFCIFFQTTSKQQAESYATKVLPASCRLSEKPKFSKLIAGGTLLMSYGANLESPIHAFVARSNGEFGRYAKNHK